MSSSSATGSTTGTAFIASAGIAGTTGAGNVVITGLPVTGAGLTTLLVVMATSFMAVGWVLVWNPLGRGRRTPDNRTMVSIPAPD